MNVVLIGSGGCMREIAWQMMECGSDKWNIEGYTDLKPVEGGVYVCQKEIKYLGTDSYFDTMKAPVNAVIAVGNPILRKKIANKLITKENVCFPNIILGNASICSDINQGFGCIICDGVRISTNVSMGNFVFCNIASTICHDCTIDDFVTLSPNVNIAGDVHIGLCTEIGMGATIIQGVSVCRHSIIGAGSVTIRNISKVGVTVAGVPSKIIKVRGV